MLIAEHRARSLRQWWIASREPALKAAVALMSVAATVFLAYEFWRLVCQTGPWGAVDLGYRYRAAHGWFAGDPVYAAQSLLDPPATHVLLWPLIGWTSFAAARWIWAFTSILAIAWTASLAVRWSSAATPLERTVAALLPVSMYATGATIGNGQLAVHLLPLLAAACLLLKVPRRTWGIDLAAAALFVGALVKPNLAAPFFWIVLFVPRSIRPALLVAAGYAALTAFAVSFQEADVVTLLQAPLAHASSKGVRPVPGNVANLQVWLGLLGAGRFALPVTAAVIGALGWWIYRHRRVDIWLLLGVAGYVSLFASYHRWYDEVLILLPMVALFRVAKRSEDEVTSTLAGLLLALTIASMLAPGGLFLFPHPWNLAYVAAQVVIWLAGLWFLAAQARDAIRTSS